MELKDKLKSLIKNRKNILKNLLKNIEVEKDGNCLYRTFSLFLYENQEKYNEIRQKIYKEAKKQKDIIKNFFIEDSNDPVIVNYKINNYIEKIKENCFWGGIIEISLFSTIFKTNISIYTLNDENDNIYQYFTNIWENNDIDKICLIRYENGNHFSLLQINDDNDLKKRINNNIKDADISIINDNVTLNVIEKANSLKTNIYMPINNDKDYYNKIYNYLLSKKLNTNPEGKVNWKKVLYPILFDEDATKTTKDKKNKISD